MKLALAKVAAGESLSRAEARAAVDRIMAGEATDAQIAGLLIGLRVKGETTAEIAGAAEAMRAKATPVVVDDPTDLVDTCGTGGDGQHTFNVSTAAAFVAAGAGVRVAKHGNRSVSSRCGSADVLEALGVRMDLGADGVARCIEQAGIGFMFAPIFHGAMKHALGPRRDFGVRTVFNLLGPLTNPAGVRRQVVGVFAANWVRPMADVLRALGSVHALVVHGAGGLDELSLAGPNHVAELRDGSVTEFMLDPTELGLPRVGLEALAGGDAAENAAILRAILSGEPGAGRDLVRLNAAAAIHVSGRAATMADGLVQATHSIDSGAATAALDRLIRVSQTTAA